MSKTFPIPFLFVDPKYTYGVTTEEKIKVIKDHFESGKKLQGTLHKPTCKPEDITKATSDFVVNSIKIDGGRVIGDVIPANDICKSLFESPPCAFSIRPVYLDMNTPNRKLISSFLEDDPIPEGETPLNATFEQIIEALTCGNKITRGKGVIYLVPASSYPKTRNTLSGVKETDEMVKYGPYLACTDQKTGITYPYAFTAEDVLSKDWRSLGFD